MEDVQRLDDNGDWIDVNALAPPQGLDNKKNEQLHLWRRGDRCMSREAWNRLVADADRAWEVALKASYEAGNPFNDREGARRCDDPRDLVGLALREWCANDNLKYD